MKKIYYIIELILFIIIINPFACSINQNLTTAWTVSGTTIFNGTPPGGTTIKLAGFFSKHNQSVSRVIVSNVVTATHLGEFSLDIDASGLDPDDFDEIELIMWEDDNNNDLEDLGEKWYDTEPASGGCPVFGDDPISCTFMWHDTWGCIFEWDKGWNVSKGFDPDESVDTAVLTGARITNENSF